MPHGALISPRSLGGSALDFDPPLRAAPGSNPFRFGLENRLAARAIHDFLDEPDTPYNPLVLIGAPGTGKTHLAHGVAARFELEHPGARVHVDSGAEFARDYASAVESRSVSSWRREVRGAALVVLDDLGQMAGKAAAQAELANAIDALLADDGRLLVTARLAPGQLGGFSAALVGRLSAGLCVSLSIPGPAARLAIVRDLAGQRDLPLAEDAARLLADELAVAAPELSGALHELAAHAARPHEEISQDAVRRLLAARPDGRSPALREIAAHTARHFALRVADLRSASRRQAVVLARGVAMYLARQLTDKSLATIGRYFGGRDHTTVLHGCRKTEAVLAEDATLRQSIAELRLVLAGA